MNCTPFVRQYGILKNKWGVYYAKRSTKSKVYARIQGTRSQNHVGRKAKLSRDQQTV